MQPPQSDTESDISSGTATKARAARLVVGAAIRHCGTHQFRVVGCPVQQTWSTMSNRGSGALESKEVAASMSVAYGKGYDGGRTTRCGLLLYRIVYCMVPRSGSKRRTTSNSSEAMRERTYKSSAAVPTASDARKGRWPGRRLSPAVPDWLPPLRPSRPWCRRICGLCAS